MRLSAFTVVDAPPPGAPDRDRLKEVVRLARGCEAAGLSGLWVAEHHFQPSGLCAAPPVLLAACGSATRTLRLGSMVSVLPFHRAIDVAEEYATLDRLLDGRLNLGVGSGYIPLELEGFGVDSAQKRERFDTTLQEVLRAFQGEPISIAPGAPPVRLNVTPVQRPHPPIWVAVQRREAIAHVARRGFSVALIPYATVADRAELAAEIEEYRAHLPAGARGEVAVALHVYAGPHPDVARRALGSYLESRHQHQSTHYLRKRRHNPAGASPEGIEKSGLAVLGPAARVARELSTVFEPMGVDELLGIFDFGGLPEEEVLRSVEHLGAAWRHVGT